MNRKAFSRTLRIIAVLVLAVGTGAQAQAPSYTLFRGVINDYTPATGVAGPWEMHGAWSLKLKGESGKADFSGVMTMEHSDYWILANPANIDDPGTRSPHTHNITMTDALVSYDTSVCPLNNPVTTGPGLVVTGPVSITGNGSPAPFEVKGPSTLQVCINGGTEVQFSNVSLVLTGPATGHFGTHAIHGVVRTVRNSNKDKDKDKDKEDADRH
jgi:hypothetical protein